MDCDRLSLLLYTRSSTALAPPYTLRKPGGTAALGARDYILTSA
jgi:hypothetical protein